MTEPKAICAVPFSEGLTLRRGRRPYHVQRERIGTWETSSGPRSPRRSRTLAGTERVRRRGTAEESDALRSTDEAPEQSRMEKRRRRAGREGGAVGGSEDSGHRAGLRTGSGGSLTPSSHGPQVTGRPQGLIRRLRRTSGRSRMRESRTSGSVRGAASNRRPYRDPEPAETVTRTRRPRRTPGPEPRKLLDEHSEGDEVAAHRRVAGVEVISPDINLTPGAVEHGVHEVRFK